jgi:hypothetical protein
VKALKGFCVIIVRLECVQNKGQNVITHFFCPAIKKQESKSCYQKSATLVLQFSLLASSERRFKIVELNSADLNSFNGV